jgi:hypothetical protein
MKNTDKDSVNNNVDIAAKVMAESEEVYSQVDDRIIEMIDHMSYWGFECVDDEDGFVLIHEMYPTILVNTASGGVSFTVVGIDDATCSDEFFCEDGWLSFINTETIMLRLHVAECGCLNASAWIPLGYCKHCFSVFMWNLCRDLNVLRAQISHLMV